MPWLHKQLYPLKTRDSKRMAKAKKATQVTFTNRYDLIEAWLGGKIDEARTKSWYSTGRMSFKGDVMYSLNTRTELARIFRGQNIVVIRSNPRWDAWSIKQTREIWWVAKDKFGQDRVFDLGENIPKNLSKSEVYITAGESIKNMVKIVPLRKSQKKTIYKMQTINLINEWNRLSHLLGCGWEIKAEYYLKNQEEALGMARAGKKIIKNLNAKSSTSSPDMIDSLLSAQSSED